VGVTLLLSSAMSFSREISMTSVTSGAGAGAGVGVGARLSSGLEMSLRMGMKVMGASCKTSLSSASGSVVHGITIYMLLSDELAQ